MPLSDTIRLGQTYRATMPETRLVKRRGGYYTGHSRQPTGKTVLVTFRADSRQGSAFWGEWVEICGARQSSRNHFTAALVDMLTLA